MREYRFEIFDEGGSQPRARWLPTDGPMAERPLGRDDVSALVTQSRASYARSGPAVGHLGANLYRWLDGPTDRWLTTARATLEPILLRLPHGEQLSVPPWELLYDGGYLAVDPACPIAPVRTCSPRAMNPYPPANRPLRLLFMACSPLAIEPVLDFEAEEAVILAAASGRIEVVVEESGSLEGLRQTLVRFPRGHFDAVHLSGHAVIDPEIGPQLLMEDAAGAVTTASAADIAATMRGAWPRLTFVSGCSTAGAPSTGAVTSMAESLVQAGAPAVLGWALPVGDQSASNLAAVLYGELARGADVLDAVTQARLALASDRNPTWHLLRLCADSSPFGPVVTPLGTPGRRDLHRIPTSTLFLDAAGQVRVADRAGFVGRRRDLQRLLRELRPEEAFAGPQVSILHGMGGLGKSSLTARLLDRMTATHPHQAVYFGKIDARSLGSLGGLLDLSHDRRVEQQINEILNEAELPLADRLRYVLAGPLADRACVFVFDDFESGNLQPNGGGGHLCTPEALEVLVGLSTAIKRLGSRSRIVITSRHDFPLPAGLGVVRYGVLPLSGVDLDKKLRLTRHLSPASATDPVLRKQTVAAAAGIPRLIERLDNLLETSTGAEPLQDRLSAIADAELEYRDELALVELLDLQTSSVRRVLALAATYEIAVPYDAVLALAQERDTAADLSRAVSVGLIQSGLHPTTGEERLLVSPLLRPLLSGMSESPSATELVDIQRRAARVLYQLWVGSDDPD